MAWERKGKGKYYYRSLRVEGRVVKRYCGGGYAGRWAAQADAIRRDQDQADAAAMRAAMDRLDRLMAAFRQMLTVCELVTAATLLSRGYRRPGRHTWRRWNNGIETLATEGSR